MASGWICENHATVADHRSYEPLGCGELGTERRGEDDHRVRSARAHHAKLSAELARLEELNAVRSEEWRKAGYPLNTAEQYVKAGPPPGTRWEYLEPPMPKLVRGQTLAEAVEAREAKVRQLQADNRRIEGLPQPSALVRKRVREQIAAIASLGAPSAARLMTGGDVSFVQTSRRVPAKLVAGDDAALVNWEDVDTFALTVHVNQDRIIATLDADITARSDDANAMTPEQKEQALAAVVTEQLALDREIAELVFRAHSEGQSGIELKADVHPLAVLSLELVADLRRRLRDRRRGVAATRS